VLAVELAGKARPDKLASLHIDVADDGLTLATPGAANAQVALELDAAAFMKNFVATRY
jgi:hypothetical protein